MRAGVEGLVAGPRERRSPALGALFEALEPDGRHSVLDLGPACGAHLQVLHPFATQVRFADLQQRARPGPAWEAALRGVPPNPVRPYDVVLAWDLFDRLDVEGRSQLVSRLVAVTGPRARVYAVVGGEARGCVPCRFELLDFNRIAEWPEEPGGTAGKPILPAHLERALAPFEIVNAYMLRTGAREYVAMKSE